MISVDQVANVAALALAGIAAVATMGAALFARKGSVRLGSLFSVDFEREVEAVRAHLPSDADPEDKQYALQREYHSRSLAQSRQSFWFSLMSAGVGFLVIVSAVATAVFGKTQNLSLPSLQIVSGTVIEAVSALFFVQSNKARELMADFFDKLREDRKFEESLALARNMGEGETREKLQAILSLAFSGSVDKDSYSHLFGSSVSLEVLPSDKA